MAEISTVSSTNLPTNSVQAVLFDLDGVIIDSEPLHVKALQATCQYFGFTLREQDIVNFKGWTEAKVASHFIQGHATASSPFNAFIAHKSQIYSRLIRDELTLIEGVVDFMQFCRAKKLRLALTTSALAENTASVLKKFQLAGFFEAIVTGQDVANSKPHPEPYLKTAQKLQIHPHHCLVIEDSIHGVRSGKSAGCRVAGITTSFARRDLEAAGADLVIDTFAEARNRLFKTLD